MKNVYNPYLGPTIFCPDGEPRIYEGRVYVYSSQDHFNSTRYCPGNYRFFSADVNDLSSWCAPECSYPRKGKGNPFGAHCLWAPDCVRGKDGLYYLYYCFNFDNKIAVARSERPDGPFTFYGYVRHEDGKLYGHKKGDRFCFDPGAIVTSDGNIYLYSGFSPRKDLIRMLKMQGKKNVSAHGCQALKLKDDMKTMDGNPKDLIPGYENSNGTGFEGHEFYEAASMREINGKFYCVYSSILSHELCYAISDKPDGGFVFGGPLISNGDIGYQGRSEKDALNYWGNNHGSLVQIKEQWYIFYHRQTNKNEQTRQGCAEKITIKEDGSIAQVEMTSCGLNEGPLPGIGKYPSYIACNLVGPEGAVKCSYGPFSKGKYKEHPCLTVEDNTQYVQNLRNKAYCGFKYFKNEGANKLIVIARSGKGSLFIQTDKTKNPVASIPLRDIDQWQEYEVSFHCEEETFPLYFTYQGEESIDLLSFELSQ